MRSIELEVRNASGLHARPAATFVRVAGAHRSKIRVTNLSRGKGPADAKAYMSLIGLGVSHGHRIAIEAEGEDEGAAIEALRDAVEGGLGEALAPVEGAPPEAGAPVEARASGTRAPGGEAPEASVRGEPAVATPSPPPAPAVTGLPSANRVGLLTGLPGAPGVAIGPAWRFHPAATAGVAPGPVADEAAARAILEPAIGSAVRQLEDIAAAVRARGADEEAKILEAQALMATDPSLLDEAVRRAGAGTPPVDALRDAARGFADNLAGLDDPLLAARAADVLDVAERIARLILGVSIEPPARPAIAVADDLPPSVTAELPPGSLLGIALQGGTPTAHAAILARGLGIPAVVGVAGLLAAVDGAAADELMVDGDRGEVVVAPAAAERAAFKARAAEVEERRARGARLRDRPLATADGARIRLLANIGSPRDLPRALAARPEGVGLLRTEFLFMERSRPPTEKEQADAYREIFEAFGSDRPVVVRLADIGGDKQIPYLDLPAEANPFLGVRAIRLAYRSPDLLVTQLRAISGAAAASGVIPHVMAPMVATLADVALFDDLVDAAQDGLARDGAPRAERLVRGIMVEIPSAALMASELARRVEFFSIGTNDLTQYLLAADRTNAALGTLQDALHPAVLRAIAAVVAGARESAIPVAVCGELAGDPAGALVLVGLGVDELSADPSSLDGVRAAVGGPTMTELRRLAARALECGDAAAVREMTRPLLERAAVA